MVEALGQCRYIPALQDGKPIGLQIDWSVARTPGGPRSPFRRLDYHVLQQWKLP
jgi:hypothetical protein